MKKISIKYNPYLVETTITVDGKSPKSNSALNVGRKRLQEWVEQLPQILLDEYRDSNFAVDFTGNSSDYEDIRAAFDNVQGTIDAKCSFHKTKDIAEVERTIDSIFKEIQEGPISELRDQQIVNAFEKAKNSRFEINVVATMSSGKSTLINALLGQQLMPAANEATTATIVKIVDSIQEGFSAIALDKSGNQLGEKIDSVTLEDMKRLNASEEVSTIELHGKIPFVSSVGMKLVIVDTPGPNNSRDSKHQEMTYRMISDSEKSLVLYVMNGQQLGINDEKIFLDYVCQSMKQGGKQGRERFIFAVNKMDAFKPKDEGLDCIENALEKVKSSLEERGIHNPNIFPVTACAALELRTDDDEPMALEIFKRGSKKYPSLHFDNYYQYSNLPQAVRTDIEEIVAQAEKANDNDTLVEVRTGIVSIEKAISQYINKYARTTKVADLVSSFNEKLKELSAVAHLEDAIRKDKATKAKLENQITQIKRTILSAQNAQSRSKSIDKIDLKSTVEREVQSYINQINRSISRLLSGHSNRVEKSRARRECANLERECKALSTQIKIQIEKILDNAYKETINQIVEDYKKDLSALNMDFNSKALSLNPAKLVSSSLANLSSIIEDNTIRADESYTVRDTRTVRKEGGFLRKAASFLTLGLVDDYTMETEDYDRKVEKYVDYVDMNEVASDYLVPFRSGLEKTKKSAINYVVSETQRLKEYIKQELVNIDLILNEKLDSLAKTEADTQAKGKDIALKEKKLQWLESIQKKVNDIIVF